MSKDPPPKPTVETPLSDAVEEGGWTSAYAWTAAVFALAFFLEAWAFGLAPLAVGWYDLPPGSGLQPLLFAWPPLWLVIGVVFAGPLADRVGRKRTLSLMLALFVVGSAVTSLGYTAYLVLTSLALLLFAAGGVMNTALAAMQEMIPRRHRSKVSYNSLNFVNLGGLTLAYLALDSAFGGISFQKGLVGAAALVAVALLFVTRYRMAESVIWLELKGRRQEAADQARRRFGVQSAPGAQGRERARGEPAGRDLPSAWLRFVVCVAMGAANVIGYGLLTYVLGPYFYPNLAGAIVLVANASALAAGIPLTVFADRVSRRWTLLGAFSGTTLFSIVAYALLPDLAASAALFWVLLVVLSVFFSVGFLAANTLRAEVWPTARRGSLLALVGLWSVGPYISVLYLASGLDIYQYTLFDLGVWLVGLVGAAVWFARGLETGRGASVSVASGERP
ncbi:MAG TPA: MFS transporter [Nitrososphaerales archaeon]|nr:MFS transporter [Nitrososphaerales archaeon]